MKYTSVSSIIYCLILQSFLSYSYIQWWGVLRRIQGHRRGTGGVQKGYRRGTERVQEGYRKGTERVQDGYRRGTGGV